MIHTLIIEHGVLVWAGFASLGGLLAVSRRAGHRWLSHEFHVLVDIALILTYICIAIIWVFGDIR